MRDALRNNAAKRVLKLAFSAQEIEDTLPTAIKSRSVFSAGNMYASVLTDLRGMLGGALQPAVVLQPDGTLRKAERFESLSHAKIRTEIRQGLLSRDYAPAPGDEGTIKDLTSDRRIDLVINTQGQMARGYARQRAVQSKAIRETFPADRLYRAVFSKKRRDWLQRWNEAKSELGDATDATTAMSDNGPFVASKNDPIWEAISRFGTGYSPFDYNSGMRTRSVLASEARRYGITDTPEEQLDPMQDGLTARLRPDTPRGMLDALLEAFPGSQIADNVFTWAGE